MRSYTSGHISLGELRAWKAAGITPTMLPGDEEILAAGAPNFMAVNWYCSTVVDTAAAEGEGGVLNIGAAFRARNPYLDYTEWDGALIREPCASPYVSATNAFTCPSWFARTVGANARSWGRTAPCTTPSASTTFESTWPQ